MVSTRQLQLISQRVQAVFAHCHAHCRALTVNLKKGIFKVLFYSSHASVGDREYTIILFISNIFCQQYMYNFNDRERGCHFLLWNFSAPPPPSTPQYLTILMTERGGHIIFCRILAPPSPDAKILNYLNDRERGGGAIIFCRILAPPNAPPLTRRHNT